MSDYAKHGEATSVHSLFHALLCILVVVSSLACLFTPYYYLSLAPAMLLVGAMILGRAPHMGYYAIVFLIPFGLYRSIGVLAGIKIHWVIAAGVICVLLLQGILKKQRLSTIGSNLWGPLALLCVLAFLTNLFSSYPATAYRDLVRFLLGLAFFTLGIVLLDKERLRKGVTYAIVISVGIGSFLALLGYFFHIAAFAHDATPGDFTRGSGGTAANNLALMICFSTPLVVYAIMHARSVLTKLVFIGILFTNVLALMSTFSRGGALVFSAVCLLLAFSYRRLVTPRRVGFLIITALVGVFIALAVVPDSYWERQASLLNRTVPDKAIGRRASYLVVGWGAIKENPLFGSGMGTFRKIYAESDVSRSFNKYGLPEERYAHNTYMEVLVGTGLVGFTIFLILLVRIGKNLLKAKRIYKHQGNVAMTDLANAYLLSFVSLLLYFFIKSAFEHKFFFVLMAVTQALMTEAIKAQAEASDE